MNPKFLAAAAFAATLVPAIANAASADAQRHAGAIGDAVPPKAVTEYDSGATNCVSAFLTRLIIPDARDARRPPVAYADNPNLIGHGPGPSDAQSW